MICTALYSIVLYFVLTHYFVVYFLTLILNMRNIISFAVLVTNIYYRTITLSILYFMYNNMLYIILYYIILCYTSVYIILYHI